MKGQNRIARLLQDTSGASFMFVLGIMLLLMAIGVSTLVAASANAGFALKQKEHSQIMILDDSIHKNIMYSLQHAPEDPALLSYQLVMAIYEATTDAATDAVKKAFSEGDIDLDIDLDGPAVDFDLNNGNIKVKSVKLSFPRKVEEMVIVTKEVSPIPGIIGREPKTATINAEMIVTVEIEAVAQKKIVKSRATYKYTGGVLSDDPTGTGVAGTMRFALDSANNPISGEWRLIKHENVDL